MLTSRLKRYLIGAIVAVLAAATIVVPGRAIAKTVIDYDPTETVNPVADNITRLNVNKLEKGARDYVEGAHMAIIEKETGKVVTEWTTDGSTHEVARNAEGSDGALNVDTVYILRELEVPEGYEKATDVEFVIHSDDFNTTGEIISGSENGNADSEAIRGSGSVQAFVINLYDAATVNVEDTVTKTNRIDREEGDDTEKGGETGNETENETGNETERHYESHNSVSSTNKNSEALTKTGDDTSSIPAIVALAAGVAIIVTAIVLRKRN